MTQTDAHEDAGMQSSFDSRYDLLTSLRILVFSQCPMIVLRRPWQIFSTEKHRTQQASHQRCPIQHLLHTQVPTLTYLNPPNSQYETWSSKEHLEPWIVPRLSQNHRAPLPSSSFTGRRCPYPDASLSKGGLNFDFCCLPPPHFYFSFRNAPPTA